MRPATNSRMGVGVFEYSCDIRGWFDGRKSHPRMRPRIHEWASAYSNIRVVFVDGLMEEKAIHE